MAATTESLPSPAPGPVAPRDRPPVVALAVLVALLGVAGYAAFAGGGRGQPEEARVEVALALLGVVAAAAWLGARSLRPRVQPATLAGLVLLAGLAAWTGASLAWSVTPDASWSELNRTLGYLLAVALAAAVAGSFPRAPARAAAGLLVIGVAVALYALAGKVLPGVVEHTEFVARLREPLEYWNALGLLCALAALLALRIAALQEGRRALRALALVSLVPLLACLAFTYSRGAIVALLAGVVVLTALPGPRLRGLAALALAALVTAPALVYGLSADALTVNAAPRDERVDAGLLLGGLLLAAVVLLGAAVPFLARLDQRTWSGRRVWQGLAVLGAALVVAGVALAAASDGGVRGTVDDAVDRFTAVEQDDRFDPGRFSSVSSGNRWAWWQEGFAAFTDEPVLGWGAGSFSSSRRLYRIAPGEIQQPHDLPIQWAAELGAVGLALGVLAFALLFAGAWRGVRERPPGVQAALFALAAAWAAHALIDWDWEIPGVTLPALVALGVLGARPPRPCSVLDDDAPVARALALAAVCLLLLGVGVSAVLPALADGETADALATAADRRATPGRLEAAARDAERAARLDPTAVRPLFAAASIADRRGRLLEARDRLLGAVERQPASVQGWVRLSALALRLADRQGALRAMDRALALDPGNTGLLAAARRLQAAAAPPSASATATGTPLAPAPSAAPPVQPPAGTTPAP